MSIICIDSSLLCMFSSSPEAQKDNVLQPRGEVTADEGHSVTLDCLYNTTSSNEYLFWYKQEGNKSPKFILSRFKFGGGKTEDEEKYSSTLDSSLRSVPLKIQKLELSDSAVYYCALQPTVTGNSSTVDENLWKRATNVCNVGLQCHKTPFQNTLYYFAFSNFEPSQ
uniref:Ig-like domain-containing protein n=1 Tax=Salarias fasciatus TaxID=181472 RepID=A0A672H6T1_SALFA